MTLKQLALGSINFILILNAVILLFAIAAMTPVGY